MAVLLDAVCDGLGDTSGGEGGGQSREGTEDVNPGAYTTRVEIGAQSVILLFLYQVLYGSSVPG